MNLLHSGRANAFLFGNDHYDIPNKVEWVQYTGLKDKNGVEIYEGDIMWTGERSRAVQIVWSNNKGKFAARWDNRWSPHKARHFYKGMEWVLKSGEVIGNIYENPDLLK